MADEEKVLQLFPDPPPFFKHFTTDNLKRLQDIEDEASHVTQASNEVANAGSKLSPEQILALPTELRYLIPPPPPADEESFHVFGETTKSSGTKKFSQDMSWIADRLGAPDHTLDDWRYAQLYPSSPSTSDSHSANANIDRQAYLNRFNRSLIIEYIRLLGIIALDPTSPGKNEVLKHILNLVCNMHSLINEYRPHQARETLIRIMEEQVARKKKEIEGVKGMREKVRSALDGFGKAVQATGEVESGETGEVLKKDGQDDARKHAQRDTWDALDEVLGH
ncbi:mediator of RNA polymerase II transcription subunit 7 [Didymella exigua CBS 183.55]|uniref:Mediator of RNA polymerase II transcription subunit 7 n=1 Tax=Didymella exigua CBS 183.55 TaxID=1150837 RepID=A0A6A5RHM0_9PLEO|nr:mediator of RNA polymerase II transcription subunit 7 [Didymella exigua CBS 183.55]KAF1925956.1 mediator of RNA polymerase II transcription subunit 7 [Didymella exigua CBS 183.55]